ncbi:hypothetical protein C8J56DRAFT_880985 [Mycena floridula]|nr:hypothetical protein C8J56DRAFT_880985 [Mycena floridula]
MATESRVSTPRPAVPSNGRDLFCGNKVDRFPWAPTNRTIPSFCSKSPSRADVGMSDFRIVDATYEEDGNIISLQLESPPSLSFHEMRLADLRRFQIKPVSGIPLNQQAPGVYLHPTEADTIVTVPAASEPASSQYMDALVAEEAAIAAEMAKFDEPVRKAMDAAVRSYNQFLLIVDHFPTSVAANEWATKALQSAFSLRAEQLPNTHVQLLLRRGLLDREYWKNELRPLVADRYHLSPQAELATQSALVTDLLQNCTFLHKLECCLEEWKSGQKVDLTFNADSYRERYIWHYNIGRTHATEGSWRF